MHLAGTPCRPDALAVAALRGVDRNRALIVEPWQARVLWRLHRAAPRLTERRSLQAAAWARSRYGLDRRRLAHPNAATGPRP